MTYGWAILVVMIVGIAIWQLGVFNMGAVSITSTGFTKVKPQLAATGVAANGDVKLMLTNGLGTTIDLSTLKIVDVNHPTDNSCTVARPTNLVAGGNGAILIDHTSRTPQCVKAGKPGDVFNIRVSISYKVSVGGVETQHSDSGTIRGPFE